METSYTRVQTFRVLFHTSNFRETLPTKSNVTSFQVWQKRFRVVRYCFPYFPDWLQHKLKTPNQTLATFVRQIKSSFQSETEKGRGDAHKPRPNLHSCIHLPLSRYNIYFHEPPINILTKDVWRFVTCSWLTTSEVCIHVSIMSDWIRSALNLTGASRCAYILS